MLIFSAILEEFDSPITIDSLSKNSTAMQRAVPI